MPLDRIALDPWVVFVSLMAFAISIWISSDAVGDRLARSNRIIGVLSVIAVVGMTYLATGMAVGFAASVKPLLAFVCILLLLGSFLRNLSHAGIAWHAISLLGLLVGWAWLCLLVIETGLPFPVKALAVCGLTMAQLLMALRSLELFAREALLTHEIWRAPTTAPRRATSQRLKVSVHLPCYAEPPEVVKETMNRIAAQDYDNYEVLICDNNTQDEALWRPLERHAAELNARAGYELFRFFHVAPLAGAKAGALNFLIEKTAADAELVAVIDADYLAEPDFLARLVPFFDDPGIAYVQTPHDYRDFAGNAFLTGCYWEYMPNNKIDMLGIHEYGGAFTIGTMCLLRTEVLKAVGGWAEWCLTEDSEVSVRLRAAGYRGIYIGETFGRGLIPVTFEDYKKQRYRWTAGPVQQLVRHWRLFLPQPWAKPMPGWTKLLEIVRCAAPLQTLVTLVCGLAIMAAITIAAILDPAHRVAVPALAWGLMAIAAATYLVRTSHRYRLTGCTKISDMIRGEIARASLSYVVLQAGVAGLSGRPLAWLRTPKFGKGDGLLASLLSARWETLLGLAGLGLATTFFSFRSVIGEGIGTLFAISTLVMALRFLCAPYMAWLSYRQTGTNSSQSGKSGRNSSGLGGVSSGASLGGAKAA